VLKEETCRIEVCMGLDNQTDAHRVRVFIPTAFVSDSVVADNQLGLITRPTDDPAMQVWLDQQWKEAPVSVY
jgi:mannosylglycerate hydrolase